MFQLVDYLDSLLVGVSSQTGQLTLQRDIVLLLLMWETPMRGMDCGKLTWADFFLPSGWQAPIPWVMCSFLLVKPNGTKTVKRHRSGAFPLTAGSDPKNSCLAQLVAYLELLYDWLYLGKRLNKHLQDAGLYASESNQAFGGVRGWWLLA